MMKRRTFFKSSMLLTGAAAALGSARWVLGKKVTLAFYFPTPVTPNTFKQIISVIKNSGIDAGIENVFGQDRNEIISKVQNGYYAGVFMSTNLVAETVPVLTLLSDGPDSPTRLKLNEWYGQNQELWIQTLSKYNLHRVPFVDVGPRRGIWVSKKQNIETFDGKLAFADGLWKKALNSLNAKASESQLTQGNIPEVFVASNLFAAEQTGIDKIADLHTFDEQDTASTFSSNFDLYLNKNYWNSLGKNPQESLVKLIEIGGEKINKFISQNDERLYLQMLGQAKGKISDSRVLSKVTEKSFFRQLRTEYFKSAESSQVEKELAESFNKSFPLNSDKV